MKKDINYYQKKLKELELENALEPEKNKKGFKERKSKNKKKKNLPKEDKRYTTINHFSSKGEEIIKKFLKDKNIKFEYDKFFKDLINPRTNQHLFVDFYLPELNTVIEFNGEQHYNYVPRFHGEDKALGLKRLSYQKYRDDLKRFYCYKNKIKIIIIHYNQQDLIESILIEKLKLNT